MGLIITNISNALPIGLPTSSRFLSSRGSFPTFCTGRAEVGVWGFGGGGGEQRCLCVSVYLFTFFASAQLSCRELLKHVKRRGLGNSSKTSQRAKLPPRAAAKLSPEETGNPEELVKQHLFLFHNLPLFPPPTPGSKPLKILI